MSMSFYNHSSYGNFLCGSLPRTEIVGWLLSDQKSARSLKSNEKALSVWDLYALVDLSAISPLGWKNLPFIERSLRDHWKIDEMTTCWEIASIGDHWEIVLDWDKTLRRWWRSLDDHWEILVIAGRSLKDHWEIWPFVHCSTISQWSPSLCKWCFSDGTSLVSLRCTFSRSIYFL